MDNEDRGLCSACGGAGFTTVWAIGYTCCPGDACEHCGGTGQEPCPPKGDTERALKRAEKGNDMREHHLKTWPSQFEAVLSGVKTFEYRRNDRGFEKGDTLILCEFDPHTSRYSGKRFHVRVTYIVHGNQFGVPAGFCVMSVKEIV